MTFQDEALKNDINIQQTLNSMSLNSNDYIWIAKGSDEQSRRLLGRIRASCIDRIENENIKNGAKRKLCFVWIEDFPLFLKDEETGKLESSHHPFTAPKSYHKDLLYDRPEDVIGENFDLVINGREIGGGSIRITDGNMQEYVLKDILGCDSQSLDYFMEALKSGAPPHGGFAIGLDRLVALICNENSIRDVIAFPKSAHGKDLMANSPSPISDDVRKLYNLKS